MKKAAFMLAIRDAGIEFLSWNGYQSGVPGLVVCREPWRADGAWYPGEVWQVTHEASGGVVGEYRYETRAMAVSVAKALGELGVDWTGSIVQLTRDKDLKGRVRAALKEVGL